MFVGKGRGMLPALSGPPGGLRARLCGQSVHNLPVIVGELLGLLFRVALALLLRSRETGVIHHELAEKAVCTVSCCMQHPFRGRGVVPPGLVADSRQWCTPDDLVLHTISVHHSGERQDPDPQPPSRRSANKTRELYAEPGHFLYSDSGFTSDSGDPASSASSL
jgi:hypothetical protein